jgi:hypothetical protein
MSGFTAGRPTCQSARIAQQVGVFLTVPMLSRKHVQASRLPLHPVDSCRNGQGPRLQAA